MNIWQANRHSENLQSYIEQELDELRSSLSSYEQQHPEAAGRLGLSGGLSTEPDMSLMLQGMAFLTARLNKRLDDGYESFCQQLLEIMAQELIAPLPAVGIARFSTLKTKQVVKLNKGSRFVLHSNGRQHTFTSPVSVDVPPWSITSAELSRGPFPANNDINVSANAGLNLQLTPIQPGMTPLSTGLKSLLFYFDSLAPQANTLFDLACGNLTAILVQSGDQLFQLKTEQLTLPALEKDWWLLPDDGLVFPGLRLLQEFFAYPNCFRFLQLSLGEIAEQLCHEQLSIWLLFDDAPASLIQCVDEQHIRLGCLPIVNLYDNTLGPTRMTNEQLLLPIDPGPVFPDGRIFRINKITDVTAPEDPQELPAFLKSGRHDEPLSWLLIRKQHQDQLIFSDLTSNPSLAEEKTLTISTLCFDSTAVELKPNSPLDCLSEQLPGSKAMLHGRGWPSRSGMLENQSSWSLLTALLLNRQTLFSGKDAHLRLAELLSLFYRPDSGIDPQILESAVQIDCDQEMMPMFSAGRFFVGLGCHYQMKLKAVNSNSLPVLLFIHLLERLLVYWCPFGSYCSLSAGLTDEAISRWTFPIREL